MYVFWFNSQQGRDNKIYCAEVINKPKAFNRKFKSLLRVEVNPESVLVGEKSKRILTVPEEEGVIYRRCFWLKKEDLNRALDIVNNYLKNKWLKERQKAEEISSRYKFQLDSGVEIY